jgi:hypothetical protein
MYCTMGIRGGQPCVGFQSHGLDCDPFKLPGLKDIDKARPRRDESAS